MGTLKAVAFINWVFLLESYAFYGYQDKTLSVVVIVLTLMTALSILCIDETLER